MGVRDALVEFPVQISPRRCAGLHMKEAPLYAFHDTRNLHRAEAGHSCNPMKVQGASANQHLPADEEDLWEGDSAVGGVTSYAYVLLFIVSEG